MKTYTGRYNIGSFLIATLSVLLMVAAVHYAGTILHSADTVARGLKKETLDFWVALGTIGVVIATLALGLITNGSVVETRRLVSREDIRHQESFAPILTLQALPTTFIYTIRRPDGGALGGGAERVEQSLWNSSEPRAFTDLPSMSVPEGTLPDTDYQFVLVLRNDGLGPALNAHVDLEYSIDGKPLRLHRFSAAAAIGIGGSLPLLRQDLKSVLLSKFAITAGRITYRDIFGNEYSTSYGGPNLQGYTWDRPSITSR